MLISIYVCDAKRRDLYQQLPFAILIFSVWYLVIATVINTLPPQYNAFFSCSEATLLYITQAQTPTIPIEVKMRFLEWSCATMPKKAEERRRRREKSNGKEKKKTLIGTWYTHARTNDASIRKITRRWRGGWPKRLYFVRQSVPLR